MGRYLVNNGLQHIILRSLVIICSVGHEILTFVCFRSLVGLSLCVSTA